MEFEEKLKDFINRIEKLKKVITTEEATKTSLIMPFFNILGYDIFNPNEFIPEFVADVGIKKGEKVDYAIALDGIITILIEAKSVDTNLQKHDSQLFRYFGTSSAKLAILTNGIEYRFYSDLETTNRMDSTPFLVINLLDLKENDITELKKFIKDNFEINNIMNSASNLKYANSIEKVLNDEFANPTDDFIRFILNQGIYDGIKTQNTIEKYRPIIKRSLNTYINNLVNIRLQNALNTSNEQHSIEKTEFEEKEYGIITTTEELESYYTIKAILSEYTNPKNLFYKDTYSYFGILYENKVTKWICRVYLKENSKYLIIPDTTKKEIRYDINTIEDIYSLKVPLINRLNDLIK